MLPTDIISDKEEDLTVYTVLPTDIISDKEEDLTVYTVEK